MFDLAKQKKYVCFRLRTVPKFRPLTLIFVCHFWFFTADSSHRKLFSVSSLFLLQLILKLALLKAWKQFVFEAFASVLQTTRQMR